MPPSPTNPDARPGPIESLRHALRSWRIGSVTLLSFASGLPLGLVWIAIPDWMRDAGVDIRITGLFTLAQAPWSFKVLWSPLMDRWVPPFWGRRRGWAAIAQVALLVLFLGLAGVGNRPETPWIVFAYALAIAFVSASQDIAVDAYAVDVLLPEEHGVAVGARTALYRAAMFLAGGMAIWIASLWSWPGVCLVLAACFLPAVLVTWKAPEPGVPPGAPRTLTEAVWHPFLELLTRHRAVEILAFVVLYKLADNLSQSLMRPFLHDMGYTAFDRGLVLATLGTWATVGGTFVGGWLTPVLGLGRSLWIFGILQIVSNVGYVLVAHSPPSRPLMYSAMTFESLCTGLGMGAFSVLLLRITRKRFSATQYALFSSLFGLPRILAGPVTGFTVHAVGWSEFFWLTMLAGIPGLLLLQRFAPWSEREPTFEVEAPRIGPPITTAALAARGLAGAVAGAAGTAAILWGLRILEDVRLAPGDWTALGSLRTVVVPADVSGWIALAAVPLAGAIAGLFVAAVSAARHGRGTLRG